MRARNEPAGGTAPAPPPPPPPPPTEAWRGRPRRLLPRLVLSGLLALALLEGSSRLLLFSDLASDLPLAAELRRPERLAHPSEDLYWILQSEFNAGQLVPVPVFDPLVGWLGGELAPKTRLHLDADSVGERRPILFYGDSYTAGVVPRGSCFQDYLERSELGDSYRILNYGVGGYGLDQAALLIGATLEAWQQRDPVIVFGMLVDDDLDRCALSMRGWPKPRFERTGDQWVPAPAAPQPPTRPLGVSYGLRLLLHSTALSASAAHAKLCPAAAIERANREPFLTELLDELELPWVSTRGPLLSNAEQSGRPLDQYYPANGHLSPLGNPVALRAIADGLDGRFGEDLDRTWSPAQLAGSLSADLVAEIVVGEPGSAARYEYGFRPPFGNVEAHRSRLCYRVTGDAPTEVRYDLGGQVQAFEASAWFIPMEEFGPGEGSIQLSLIADGEVLFRERFVRGDPPRAVRGDLGGRQQLSITVDTAGDGQRGDWFELSSPVFR